MGEHYVLHEPLDIRVEQRDDTAVVTISGACDVSSHKELRERLLNPEVGGRQRIVVDLSELHFIDSTGLRVVIGAWNRARHAGQSFSVALPASGQVQRVFELTGVNRVVSKTA